MFFILSKVLFFIIQPVNWIVFPLLYALLGKNKLLKRRCLILGVCAAIFFTNHFVFNSFVKIWEVDTIKTDEIVKTYDIGILLGGYSNFFVRPDDDRHNYNERGGRFFQTYELYKKGKFKKFLLTGGSGFMFGTEKSEAILARDSKNTFENALFTKEILDKSYPNAKCLLITSAWHMRRSKGCFDKVGIQYTPFSVDFIGEKSRLAPASIIIPNSETLWRWELIVKEIVGTVAYKVRGYN